MEVDLLPVKLEVQGFLVVGYSNENAVIISSKHVSVVYELMRSAMLLVENWCLWVRLGN